jgi:NTP pyrophosphatase (non-canonical NTP hydrolase)
MCKDHNERVLGNYPGDDPNDPIEGTVYDTEHMGRLMDAYENDGCRYTSLDMFQVQVCKWAKKNFPGEEIHHLVYGMMEELGELVHAHLKAEVGIRGTKKEHLAEAKDAVGDLLVFMAEYCFLMGISMHDALWDTWGEVQKRDWQKYPHDGRTR